MKKCYSLLRWPCLLQDVLNRRLHIQNKPAAVAPKETIAHHFFVSGIGQKKTVGMLGMKIIRPVKPASGYYSFLGFITLGIYTPLEARVC